MGKVLKQIAFDPKKCRAEIDEFGHLLQTRPELSERDDIQPFFKAREQLSAFVGSYIRNIGAATDLVFEYPFFGDFAADLIVGNKALRRFCVVEFEEGAQGSIFRVPPKKSTKEWSSRLEHGFSQIIDWFSLLDDLKSTQRFKRDSGDGHVRFSALLIIGRDAALDNHDRFRLDWRTDKVSVDSHPVECVTYDGLHQHMDRHLKLNTGY